MALAPSATNGGKRVTYKKGACSPKISQGWDLKWGTGRQPLGCLLKQGPKRDPASSPFSSLHLKHEKLSPTVTLNRNKIYTPLTAKARCER